MSSWLVWLIVALVVVVIGVPFAPLIFGVLKFLLWVEPRQLRGNGILTRLPRPKQLPRFGFTLHFLSNGAERLVKGSSKDGLGRRFDPLVCIGGDLSGHAVVMVFDADGVRDVLNKTDVFVKHEPTYGVLAPLLGNGLVLSSGDLWRRQRKLLTPMFHFQRLRAYTSLENEESERLVNQLAALRGANTAPIAMIATCMQLIVMRAVFGDRFDIGHMSNLWGQVNDCFLDFILAVTLLPRFVARLVPGRVRRTFTCLEQVRVIIGDAVDRARNEVGDCDDMVGQMVRLEIDRELIIDECITFMFAGRDTVSHTMGYAIYFLVQHPDIQEELHAEAESVGVIDDDAVGTLKLHAAVIRETLRLRPPLPSLNRQVAAEEGVELLGQFLPKDTEVAVSALGVHWSSAYWGEDSLEFRPSRWFEEAQKARHPFAWVPFSASTRSCIGMKLAQNATSVILAHIMRRFRIEGELDNVFGCFDGTYGPGRLDRIRFIER
jgi:cytochrome P450